MEREDKVQHVRAEWKRLWAERLDDKVRAEGVAVRHYPTLFVERGTVILATRNFKLLSLRDILEQNGIIDVYRFVSPSPNVGGWRKFIRAVVSAQGPAGRVKRRFEYCEVEKKRQQLKKGGRGWLHV
jgi:hypothetical protein